MRSIDPKSSQVAQHCPTLPNTAQTTLIFQLYHIPTQQSNKFFTPPKIYVCMYICLSDIIIKKGIPYATKFTCRNC